MTRTFVELPLFQTRWKELGLTDNDLKKLQEVLQVLQLVFEVHHSSSY